MLPPLRSHRLTTQHPSSSRSVSVTSILHKLSLTHVAADRSTPAVASPDSLSATSPYSAATKVFDIPILLEHILLFVSASAKEDAVFEGYNYYTQDDDTLCQGPTRSLFVLQRVNSLFKATISRNKVIQQGMFLRARPRDVGDSPESTGGVSSKRFELSGMQTSHSSVRWLLEEIGVFSNRSELYMRVGDNGALAFSGRTKGKQLDSNDEFASWRQMRLHCVERCGPFHVKFKHMPAEMITYEIEGEYIPVECSGRQIDDGEDMSLGELHDWLSRLMPFADKVLAAELAKWDAGGYEGVKGPWNQRSVNALESFKAEYHWEDL